MSKTIWPPLADYLRWLPRVRALGLDEADLRAIPVHPEPPDDEDFLSLGEIPPGAPAVGHKTTPTVGTRHLYAVRSEVPEPLWERLSLGLLSKRRSGIRRTGMFGNDDERVVDEENPRESWRHLDEGRAPWIP